MKKEILMYLIFGVLTTVVSIGAYSLFLSLFGIDALVANIIAWIFAVLFAFITNRIWVFASETDSPSGICRELLSFTGGRLATLGMEELILFICLKKLGMNEYLVKVAAQGFVIIANYVISKLFVFKRNK